MGDWVDGEIWAPMGSNKDLLEAKKQDELVEEGKMKEDKTSERRMHLATRLENMGYQLHGPHKGWLITRISSVDSLPTLDHIETLVKQMEKRRIRRQLMTSIQHDELVEKIRETLGKYATITRTMPGYQKTITIDEEGIRRAIALTLKAVVDRRLKLPGELSRDVTGDDLLMIIIDASQGTGEEKDENRQDDSGS